MPQEDERDIIPCEGEERPATLLVKPGNVQAQGTSSCSHLFHVPQYPLKPLTRSYLSVEAGLLQFQEYVEGCWPLPTKFAISFMGSLADHVVDGVAVGKLPMVVVANAAYSLVRVHQSDKQQQQEQQRQLFAQYVVWFGQQLRGQDQQLARVPVKDLGQLGGLVLVGEAVTAPEPGSPPSELHKQLSTAAADIRQALDKPRLQKVSARARVLRYPLG